VRDVLNSAYHDRWTSGERPTAWPPRFPHLNPLHFYLRVVDNEEALHHGIVDACWTIRNCSGIFEWMRRSMMWRIEACIQSHGGYFKHLLYMYFSVETNSCFRTNYDKDIFSYFDMWNYCPKSVRASHLHFVYGVLSGNLGHPERCGYYYEKYT
jgi:hypothetical protein